MKWEDNRLRTFVDKAQLEAWYRTTKECAEKTVAVGYDQLTAAGKRTKGGMNGFGMGNGRLVIEKGKMGGGGLFAAV
jgi:nuclear pore complex protein Nup133